MSLHPATTNDRAVWQQNCYEYFYLSTSGYFTSMLLILFYFSLNSLYYQEWLDLIWIFLVTVRPFFLHLTMDKKLIIFFCQDQIRWGRSIWSKECHKWAFRFFQMRARHFSVLTVSSAWNKQRTTDITCNLRWKN